MRVRSKGPIVFRTRWFNVERRPLRGREPYYCIHSSDGVLVVATTPDDEIVLVRQFRPVLNAYTLEIPSGHVDASESPRRAAARELYEETGFVCTRLQPLGVGRLKMDRLTSREHAFFGIGATRDPKFVKKEEIDVILARPDRLARLVRSGQVEQWSALAAFLLTDWKLGRRLPSRPSRAVAR